MIGIGVIGLGGMGSFHTNILSKVRRCRVVAGTDVSVKARRAFAKQFPHIRIYTGLADMLANPDVAAVIVTTPTLLHKQSAIAALRAGKHVLSEKPMVRTVADCRRMIDVANMLFGAATRVTANSIKLNQKATCIDTATAMVEYPRGDQLLMSWSWAKWGQRNE